ncbi:unnamed protein product [Lymnaea stagnalis]|uniref:G-protein coupled receptors family 1 profile domain-containing protein n=1 Tax=Lymnaea stagnalis TaxID=6523 RepID=A0AAV2IGQ4_LYMST
MTTLLDDSMLRSTTPLSVSRAHGDSPNRTDGNYSSASSQPEYYKDAQIGVLVVLFFLIVIGNVIVLAAIALSKERRRSRMNFFIMHLAVCDLLTGPLVVLVDLISRLTTHWYAGDAFCKVHKFAAVAVMYSSTYMLVALSIDRLDAVARPLHFTGSWLRVKVLVALAWFLSCLFAIPELVLFEVTEVSEYGGPFCQIKLSETWWKIYMTIIALSLFFIPALIILACYVAIIVVIFNSSHLMNNVSKRSKGKDGGTELLRETSSLQDCRASSQSSRGVIPQAKIRTIKMTFIIVLVFIVCWSPYFIFNICQVFLVFPKTPGWDKVNTFVQSLAPLNSAANPLIYGVFSTRICRYIRRAPVVSKVPTSMRRCCFNTSPPPKGSTPDYTSISETEDFRLTGDLRSTCSTNGSIRVPLIKQQLTEADRELLSLHIRGSNTAADTV